jgi:NAD(P)-dependent dehydrogenase (short-subunit alcohol dehydrogenase family)
MAERRVAVVTGTTSGIGKEVARGLAQQGFLVVMHGRDRARTEAAADEIRRDTAGAVEIALGDLSVRAEVERLAAELGRYGRLHALVHNAAVVPHQRRLTPEGLEQTFAANVLAPWLLADRLGDKLAGARVLTFYGGGGTTLDLDDLQSERAPFDGWDTYCRSKNALGALTLELARRRPQTVTVGVLPGLVYTEGMRNLPGRMRWFGRMGWLFMRTSAQGARTALWAITAPEVQSGKVYGNILGRGWRNELPLPPVITPEAGRRVYEACERYSSSTSSRL